MNLHNLNSISPLCMSESQFLHMCVNTAYLGADPNLILFLSTKNRATITMSSTLQ